MLLSVLKTRLADSWECNALFLDLISSRVKQVKQGAAFLTQLYKSEVLSHSVILFVNSKVQAKTKTKTVIFNFYEHSEDKQKSHDWFILIVGLYMRECCLVT